MAQPSADDPDAEIGLHREIRILRRILRDWIRTLGSRLDLAGTVEISLVLDPSPKFRPRAELLADGGQQIVLTHGTIWWAYLCAQALTRWDNGLSWPAEVPQSITAPLLVPNDPAKVRSYGDRLAAGLPKESDGFFVFLFATILCAVMFHEAAHILRGHLLLLSNHAVPDLAGTPGSLEMVDDGSDTLIQIDDLGRRDLEHDADAVAGFLMAELLLGVDELFPLWERNTPAENFTWGLVSYALFCAGVALAAPSTRAYPDAYARLMSYFYGGLQHLGNEMPNDPHGEQITIDAFTVLASAEEHIPYVAGYRILAEDDGLQSRLDELMEIMSHMPALNRHLRPFWFMPSREEDPHAFAADGSGTGPMGAS